MQTDYFVLESEANNSHPMLEWDEYVAGFLKPTPFPISRPVHLRLGKPVPRNPVMVDHHELPEPVLSTRLKEALEPLKLHCVQFVPADVKVQPDDVRRYWVMRVYNKVACMDRQHSVYKTSPSGRMVLSLNKLVLDEQVLGELPLEQRLVFVLAESTSTHLFHQTVVERMLALRPEGVRFIRADEWNDGAAFKA